MKNTSITQKQVIMITTLIGLVFVIINLLTIKWYPLPWFDEVVFIDTPINVVLEGKWHTTAMYSCGGAEPVLTYMPLYQFVLVPWIKIFGVSPLAVRSLSIAFAFFIAYIIVNSLVDINFLKSKWTCILFLLAFWGSAIISYHFRSGRVDTLNMLCVVIFLRYFYLYLSNKSKKKIGLYISAFLIPLSGLQACPFVILILLFILIFHKAYRIQTFSAIKIFITSGATSLVFVSLFFLSIHAFFPSFLVNIVTYSTTLRKLVILLLPYFGDFLHLDVDMWLERAQDSHVSLSFFQHVVRNFSWNKEFIILTSFNILAIIYLAIRKKLDKNNEQWSLLGFSVTVPIIMSVAGHFPGYYTWMAYIPALIWSIYIVDKYKDKLFHTAYFVVIISIFSLGLPSKLWSANKNAYNDISNFIAKQQIDPQKDVIASCFCPYYQLRSMTNEVYMLGIYPADRLPENVNIVIKASKDFGKAHIDNYLNKCRDEGKRVTLTDSLASPKLYFYTIEKGYSHKLAK